MAAERLIRKYANRRLYDTGGSRHVTLDDLRQLVVEGEKIKVVDDKSGEDLTRPILLQIIAEQEHFGRPVLGTELLEMIIRFSGGPMHAALSSYLEQSFTAMLRQQQTMQLEMAKALQAPFAPFSELARKNMEMWEQMKAATFGAFGAAVKPNPPNPPNPPSPAPGTPAPEGSAASGPGAPADPPPPQK
jgi:polyhydroxyalkanoate synthesis repressor PhaR